MHYIIIMENKIKDAIEYITYELLYKSYIKYIEKDKPWYVNFNKYINTEWNKLDDNIAYLDNRFTKEEEIFISEEVFNLTLKVLNIDGDEYELYEDTINWFNYDELVSYYMCLV